MPMQARNRPVFSMCVVFPKMHSLSLPKFTTTSETDTSTISTSSASSSSVFTDLNLQSHLNQYRVGASWSDSEDSDVVDTSYETDVQYEKEKQLKLDAERLKQEEITKTREANMREYFDINIRNMSSIFNLKGIQFKDFNHKLISFIFTPSDLCKKYICAHRKWYITIKHNDKWWCLKRYQMPNRSEVIKLFNGIVDDSNIMKVLEQIYKILVKATRIQIKGRKLKHKKYLLGHDVEFNSDDEKLLLSPEERKRRKEKREAIHKRMIPPH